MIFLLLLLFSTRVFSIQLTKRDNCGTGQCGQCEGHCTSDSDCSGTLKCWKRKYTHSNVLGCEMGGEGDQVDTNYCYEPCPIVSSGENGKPINRCKNTLVSFDFGAQKPLRIKACTASNICGECEGGPSGCSISANGVVVGCAAGKKCWRRNYKHSNVPGCAASANDDNEMMAESYCYTPCPTIKTSDEDIHLTDYHHGCKNNLKHVLKSSSGCSVTDGTIDIWVNAAIAANENYDILSSSSMQLGGNINMPSHDIIAKDIVTSGLMVTGSVSGSNIISADNIAPGAVTTTEIRSNAVTSGTIKNGAVNGAKIASNAVGNAQLNTNSDFTIADGKTITAGYLTASNDLKAADGAFHVVDNNIDGGSSTTVNLRGWIKIRNSPTGSRSGGNWRTNSRHTYYISGYNGEPGGGDSVYESALWANDRISIDAEGTIMSTTYIGASDERIKKDIRPLKDNESLDILRQLDAKSYEYIDQIQRHPGKIIGFIAQDVNKTIPTAVTILTKIIPNEMRLITVNFERKGIDSLEMTLNEVLSPGTYRFIFETLDDNEVAKDLTTEDGKIFYVEHQYKKEVLLYGKEIDDFLTIDKNKIFAVAYSALQQVDKNQIALEQKVASLEETIAKLSERLAALDGQS